MSKDIMRTFKVSGQSVPQGGTTSITDETISAKDGPAAADLFLKHHRKSLWTILYVYELVGSVDVRHQAMGEFFPV